MKSVTVDELPKLLGTVLAWLKAGESVELREQDTRVGTIQPEGIVSGRNARRERNRQWAERLAARQKEIFGDRMLTPEESAFIRDRGEW
jgi:hypothetical protein